MAREVWEGEGVAGGIWEPGPLPEAGEGPETFAQLNTGLGEASGRWDPPAKIKTPGPLLRALTSNCDFSADQSSAARPRATVAAGALGG